MLNLLKLDLYKMFRQKSFYIIGIISIIFSAFISFMWARNEVAIYFASIKYNMTFDGMAFNTHIFEKIMLETLKNLPVYMPAIFAILFVCSEFSTGTIKNVLTRGLSREKILISKLICCILVTAIYFILSALAIFISIHSISEINTVPGSFDLTNNFYPILSIIFFTNIALVSAALFMSFFFKKAGISSMIFFVLFLIIVPILCVALMKNSTNPTDPYIYNKWIMPFFNEILTNEKPDKLSKYFGSSAIALVLYTLIPLGVTLPIFKKQDL